jgi:hypothetical protein
MRRVLPSLLVAVALSLGVGCADDDDAAGPSSTAGGLDTDIGDGEFIDSWPATGGRVVQADPQSLEQLAPVVDEIAIVEITGVLLLSPWTPPAGSPTARDPDFQPLPWTTYEARIRQWIKGDGPEETTITIIGGVTENGPQYLDGTFLPTVGRVYVMPMQVRGETTPGTGMYEGTTNGATTYEVTDGTVHVLNNAKTHPFSIDYAGLTLEEFIVRIQEWIQASPPG